MKKILGYMFKPNCESINQMLDWYPEVKYLPKNQKEIKEHEQEVMRNYNVKKVKKYRIILEELK